MDPNVDCTMNNENYECLCRKGFFGDGHTCEAVPIYEGNLLISSQGLALMKFNLETRRSGIPIIVKSFMTAAGIDFDCFKGKSEPFKEPRQEKIQCTSSFKNLK